MEKYLFAPLLVRKLAQDDFYRRVFSLLLTAVAVLITISAVVVFFFSWKEIFDMSSQAMIGGMVFQCALVLAAYQAVHLTLMRAAEVRQNSEQAAPITVSRVLVRLAGEVFGLTAALLGLGGGVLVWLAGWESRALLDKVDTLLPFLKAGPTTFFGGAALIGQGIGYGILALLLGYLLAKLLKLLPNSSAGERETSDNI